MTKPRRSRNLPPAGDRRAADPAAAATPRPGRRRMALAVLGLAGGVGLIAGAAAATEAPGSAPASQPAPALQTSAAPATQPGPATGPAPAAEAAPATLDQIRVVMDKWVETQRLMARQRKEWQQGKEVLRSRIELIQKEISTLEEKIKEADTKVQDAQRKRRELQAESDQHEAVLKRLADAVTAMEGQVRTLFKTLPKPTQEKLDPLFKRMPEDPTKTRVSVAERFQNVLGILNAVNQANNDIAVNYEVRELADGKPSEVQAIYLGLAQAYYVSASGGAGIGRPTAEGWRWEPSQTVARDVLMALEILQGKQSAAFVPLPVEIQ